MGVKELRFLLISWGTFWHSVSELQSGGYASVSVTQRCCEVIQTGIWTTSDKHMFRHHSDSIFVPGWLVPIDEAVHKLTPEHRALINTRYVKKKQEKFFRLDYRKKLLKAEVELASLL